MKRLSWIVSLAIVPALSAQRVGPPPLPADSTRAAQLRAEVERRFGEHVRRQLDLTDEQAAKLKATQERFRERRQELMRRQRELRLALDYQMRPGSPANADSVQKLMDALQAGRAQALKLEQDEDRDMAAYLTPVQRARFHMIRQRLTDRVQDLRRGRGVPDGPRRRPAGRRPGRMPA